MVGCRLMQVHAEEVDPRHKDCYTKLEPATGLCAFVVLQWYGTMVWTEKDAQLSSQSSQTPHLLMYVKHHRVEMKLYIEHLGTHVFIS